MAGNGGNIKICPKCGAENLDFKIFCGNCREPLQDESPQIISSSGHSTEQALSHSRNISTALGSSAVLGIIIMLLPLPFTFFSFDLIADLSWRGLVAPALIYGTLLMIVMELMFLAGSFIFNREYRLAYVETPVRGILVFLLSFSTAPFLIFSLTSVFGAFAIEYAALIFLGFFLFYSWLLFFGWLGESRPEKYLPKKNVQN